MSTPESSFPVSISAMVNVLTFAHLIVSEVILNCVETLSKVSPSFVVYF